MSHLLALVIIITTPLATIGWLLGARSGALVGAAVGLAILAVAWFSARAVILRACRAHTLGDGEINVRRRKSFRV